MFILMLFSEPLQRVDKCQKQPPQLFYEKVFLEISQNLQENTCAWVPFLKNLQVWGLGIPEKWDPG